ncbi:MAG TPA: TRAM domain-containing protein [Candidatus Nanoarchaeia archaeon]|nr:TRAM domain-containing protein [Candidatus Nanoarchaeia archaeon]
MQDMSAPVKVGDELQVTIDAVGAKGDGIARVKGFVLFVSGTRQGDVVTVRITRVLQNVGFADVVRKEKKSESVEVQKEPEPEPTYEDTETFGED